MTRSIERINKEVSVWDGDTWIGNKVTEILTFNYDTESEGVQHCNEMQKVGYTTLRLFTEEESNLLSATYKKETVIPANGELF